jgi:hypothetical protein
MAMTGDEAKQLQAVLEELGFMGHIKPEIFRELTQRFNKVTFERGDSVLKQGRSGGAFFILARGTISIWADKGSERIRVASIKPTTYFGEIALLEGSERTATLVAEDNVEVLSLGKKDFFEILFAIPQIKNKIVKTAGSRKKDTDAKLIPGEDDPLYEDDREEALQAPPPAREEPAPSGEAAIPVISLYRDDASDEATLYPAVEDRTKEATPAPSLRRKEIDASFPPEVPEDEDEEIEEPVEKDTRTSTAAEVVWGLHDGAGLMSQDTTEILKFIISNDGADQPAQEENPAEEPPKPQASRKIIPFPRQKKG